MIVRSALTTLLLVIGGTIAAVNAPGATSATQEPSSLAEITARDTALLRELPVVYELREVRQPRCDAIDVKEGELAETIVDVRSHAPFPDVDKQLRYFGRPEFTVVQIHMRLPSRIVWPGMSDADRTAAAATLAALRHHESGHVRIALDEVARLNAAPFTVTPDPDVYRTTVVRRADEGLEAIARAQEAYDALTDHGRRQDRAEGVFRGPRTQLICPPPQPRAVQRAT